MKEYFLFGSDAVCELNTNGFESLLKSDVVKNGDFDIYCHDLDMYSSKDLLYQFRGWNDFEVITKEQYNLLSNASV